MLRHRAPSIKQSVEALVDQVGEVAYQFAGQVQQRTRLGTTGETVRAIRVTLEVLGQRLAGNETQHLAVQLRMNLILCFRQPIK
jgi:uncharacterized protein (DUF2267 family)